jgi:putative membrane protein
MATLAVLALVVACSRGDNRADSAAGAIGATTTPAVAPPPAPPIAPMTDANIVARLGNADSGEVSVAKLAVTKATNGEVRSYARMLATDHANHAKEVVALEKKASITPEAPGAGTSATWTAQDSKATEDRFTSLPKGAEFDSAFVNQMVADHEKVIADVQTAQGTATNADVKALLDKTLPVLQKHLEKAKELQTKLSSATGTKTP